jgi:hypothetical protein
MLAIFFCVLLYISVIILRTLVQIMYIALAIVVILIILYMVYRQPDQWAHWTNSKKNSTLPIQGASATSGPVNAPESELFGNNVEFFDGCADDMKKIDCTDTHEYSVNEYGSPGMEYKDWVASQAIEPSVLRNHAEFVKDRMDNTKQNVTGRTYSPSLRMGEMEGSDNIKWIGLRRPQHVAICNPTQVPEYNDNSFTRTPKFTWSST